MSPAASVTARQRRVRKQSSTWKEASLLVKRTVIEYGSETASTASKPAVSASAGSLSPSRLNWASGVAMRGW